MHANASRGPSPSTSPSLGWDGCQGWRVSERGGGVAEKREEASDGIGDGHPVEYALAVRVQRPEEQPACGTIQMSRRGVKIYSQRSIIHVYFTMFDAYSSTAIRGHGMSVSGVHKSDLTLISISRHVQPPEKKLSYRGRSETDKRIYNQGG